MAVTIDGSGGLSGVPAIDSDELSVAGAVTVGTTLNGRDPDDLAVSSQSPADSVARQGRCATRSRTALTPRQAVETALADIPTVTAKVETAREAKIAAVEVLEDGGGVK